LKEYGISSPACATQARRKPPRPASPVAGTEALGYQVAAIGFHRVFQQTEYQRSIGAELSAFIRAQANVADNDVDFGPTIDLFDYGYLDSFAVVEMIEMVQQRWGVDMTNTDFQGDNIRSIEAIARYIAERAA
jgi:acyl carrier protein